MRVRRRRATPTLADAPAAGTPRERQGGGRKNQSPSPEVRPLPDRTRGVVAAARAPASSRAGARLASAIVDTRLTPRQIRFALALATAPSLAEAARVAGLSPTSGIIGPLVRRPAIRAIAHARREELCRSTSITPEAVLARLWELATSDADPRAAVQACALILKYTGGPEILEGPARAKGLGADAVAAFALMVGVAPEVH